MQTIQALGIFMIIFALIMHKSGCDFDFRPINNFKHRECRMKRGDVSNLPYFDEHDVKHPRHMKIVSRPRRFVVWPEGSTLTISPVLSLPFISLNDGYQSGSLYLGFPLSLDLPSSPLRLAQQHQSASYAALNDQHPLDNHRKWIYSLIGDLLNNIGLPGNACLLRAVCEVADEPVEDLGLMGDVMNLIFSAGYGEGSDDMVEYVMAEAKGRQSGECEDQYPECPITLPDILQRGLSMLR